MPSVTHMGDGKWTPISIAPASNPSQIYAEVVFGLPDKLDARQFQSIIKAVHQNTERRVVGIKDGRGNYVPLFELNNHGLQIIQQTLMVEIELTLLLTVLSHEVILHILNDFLYTLIASIFNLLVERAILNQSDFDKVKGAFRLKNQQKLENVSPKL